MPRGRADGAVTYDPDDLARAAAWKLALDADARGERPLGVDGWAALTAWLEADPRHAAWLDVLEDTPAAAAPARRPRLGRRSNVVRRAWALGAGAAAAALAITVVVLTSRSTTAVFETADAPRAVTLPDGSAVVLNRRTRLEGRFGARERRLRLTPGGEAVFDVVHDPARPFRLEVGEDAVSVLGTRFDVDSAGQGLQVAVARGVVSVATGAGPAVRVAAGQALVRDPSGVVTVRGLTPGAADFWIRGSLIYDEAPLQQVAADLSRYGSSTITVDENAASLRFTGALAIDKGPLMLARLVTFMPIEAYRTPTGIRLRAARPRR